MNFDGTVLGILAILVAVGGRLLFGVSRHLARKPVDTLAKARRTSFTHALEVVLVAAWFGLVTGAIQVLLVLINRYVRDRFLMVGPQMFWMTPLANAAIFAGIGVLFGVCAAVQSRVAIDRWAISFFAALGVISLTLPFPQLHKLAALLIAVGIGIQAGRVMVPRLDSWLGLMKRTIVWAGPILAALAVLPPAWSTASERYATSLVPQARAGAPNVLIVVMDTVRASSLSLYGYGRPTTPNLERWARDGTTFDMALSTAPWTLKSHGTLFSGLYPDEFEGDFERGVDFHTPVLAEVFRDQGYLTGGFVANLLYTSRESGLDRGFVHYDDYRLSLRQLLLHSWIPHASFIVDLMRSRSLADVRHALANPQVDVKVPDVNHRIYQRRSAGEINDTFLEWQSANGGRPFFAFLNYFDAHFPYRSSSEFEKKFALTTARKKGLYEGAIAYMDHEIDRLLTELRRRQILDNTIVVITADHGELLGEHGLYQHANSLYLDLLHVPLIIRYPPAVPGNVRLQTAATLRDVPSTIAQLAGLPDSTFPGTSLSAHWSDAAAQLTAIPLRAYLGQVIRPDPETPARFGPMFSVFDDEFHYIRRGDGKEELFAYRVDPGELTDLAKTAAGRQKVEELRTGLVATWTMAGVESRR